MPTHACFIAVYCQSLIVIPNLGGIFEYIVPLCMSDDEVVRRPRRSRARRRARSRRQRLGSNWGRCWLSGHLKEALILLRARDPCREHHRIGALYEVLQLVNKEQGVGFKVCGMVFNRRRLTELAFFLYTALATVVPILLGSRENTKTQGDNGSSIGS